MITRSEHQKHTNLKRPALGEFHRNELAILGTTCDNISKLINSLSNQLQALYKIGYVDADHKAPLNDGDSPLPNGCSLQLTDKITYRSITTDQIIQPFSSRTIFNQQDLVLVNGNHFTANAQMVVIDPVKPLEKKLEKLTNVQLILLAEGVEDVPQYVADHLRVGHSVPVLKLNDVSSIGSFVQNYMEKRAPVLKGLVLAGGKSARMKEDKGGIKYFGQSQREYVHGMLSQFCVETYVSYADKALVNTEEGLLVINDTFLDLGPIGGIMSAMRTDPDAAWLTVACDLPYLSTSTLGYLTAHRDTSKIATCFMDSEGKFPEPLITIWEPRAYSIMLQFLAQGYSCPRKVLINTDVSVLQAPNVSEFANVNYPDERDRAIERFKSNS